MSFTVKELIEELKSYEQDREVFVQDLNGDTIPIDSTGFAQQRNAVVLYLEDENADEDEAA